MAPILYTVNILFLLSCLLTFRLSGIERQFSLSLARSLLYLPLLAAQYVYLSYDFEPYTVQVVLFSESVFGIIWLFTAQRCYMASFSSQAGHKLISLLEILFGVIAGALAWFRFIEGDLRFANDGALLFKHHGPVFFYSLFTLTAMLFMAWRLEGFWRNLPSSRRWEYKFLVVAGYLICGTMIWSASYRLTYLRLVLEHKLLLGALLSFAWGLMFYAVARHRLLNRKIFISRKIVYSTVAPFLFASYFLAVGIVSLLMRTFRLPLHFALFWFLLAMGLTAGGLYVCSGRLRRRVHFFISTHFYVNKYEYRDEWLAFSQLLQGAFSTAAIVGALRQILVDSLYTTNIMIWVGDEAKGYSLVQTTEDADDLSIQENVPGDDPLVVYLKTHDHFFLEDSNRDTAWKEVSENAAHFMVARGLVLAVPLSIRDQLVGIIGLGPEYTGGRYGYDDFDLLTALGSQAASSLLAVRMAEELSRSREREVWNHLSAFVLHDIKNAASMLSLICDNARDHIDNPEFQRDMLETIDNALKRMSKVQRSLTTLRGEFVPQFRVLQLSGFLHDFKRGIINRMPQLAIEIECHDTLNVYTDQEILSRILENLLLNSFEAGATRIEISEWSDNETYALIKILDNGPGIPEELMPDALFEPFRTS
ncbi:MAG: ATP-binding protein, partial [Syntrophobacteraceae bacterium]